MLEVLHHQEQKKGYCPGDLIGDYVLPENTGPGPQCLIGEPHLGAEPGMIAGFFGEVPVEELIDGPGLASLIGLTNGTAQNNDEPWLKFILDGRILFVSKKTRRHSISWNHLNAVDAVTGDRVITIGSYQYRIGLLKGLGPNPLPYLNGYDTPATHGSEWNRLMYNVAVADSRERGSQVGENWAEYTQNELNITTGNGGISWCQETHPTNAGRRVYRGYFSVSYLNSNTSSSATASCGWRPRLELVL